MAYFAALHENHTIVNDKQKAKKTSFLICGCRAFFGSLLINGISFKNAISGILGFIK